VKDEKITKEKKGNSYALWLVEGETN